MTNFCKGGRELPHEDGFVQPLAHKEIRGALRDRKPRIKKYGRLLSAMAHEFNEMDFWNYCPTKIIEQFWSKYNWHNLDKFNLFDLIILARSAIKKEGLEAEAMDGFLKDFLSLMIANYTIHQMNYEQGILGCWMSNSDADELKETVRMDFLGHLVGSK